MTGAAGGAGGGENASGSAGGSGSGTAGGIGGPGGGSVGGTGGNGGGGATGGAGTADSGSNGGLGGGGGGGAALVLNGSSLVVTTSGGVTGGIGGAGGGANSSFSGNLGNGGGGGAGIASASTGLQVSNSGTITGGAGGDAGFLGFLGSGATNGVGGAGGTGVSLSGASASFTNTGAVRGGGGGLLNTLNSFTGSGAGGDGGAGLVISGAGGTVSNSGTIGGGTGGYDIDWNVSQGGASGAGVILGGSGASLATGTVLTNNAGATIVGANRAVMLAASGPDNGGAGVSITGNYNTINNAGTITGGRAGNAGTAGVLVSGDNNLVVSSGTITGGGAGGTIAPSVQFDGHNNTLELRAGYALGGGAKVNGTGGTLVLGGTANAAFDLARIGTSATSFNGFSAFNKTGGSTWTLNGIYTDTSNWNVQQGTLAMASLAETTGTVSVASGAALSVLALSRVHGQVTIANGGTLVTTTTTSAAALDGLTLSPNSILEMNVTRAGNTTGLLTLGSGGLVLDGTLNITDSGNALAAGTYRLFNVIGTLTNNTMVIGPAPMQYLYSIDTSNPVFITLLVASNTSYWNGAQATPNGTVNGGSGTWDAAATNWTNATGTTSKAWGGYEAVFQGTPGTVTVDNGGVSAYLTHFLVDGYTLSGGPLTLASLSAAKPIVEVATGATATIQSVIAGTAGLDKTGAGTLTLTGANTYTGNTSITAGTLQIAGSGSILGDVANSGTLSFNPGSDRAFAGNISGTGSLTKLGGSTLTLSIANTYAGGTTVSAGVLNVRNDSALGTGAVSVASGAALEVQGYISLPNALTLSGTGVANGGALRNVSGANGLDGAITLAGDTRINNDSFDSDLGLVGGISGSGHTLVLGGSSEYITSVTGAIATGLGGVTIDVTGAAGRVILAGANTYTGVTTVNSGTLQLMYGAAIADTGAVVVNAPGSLQIYNSETIGSLAGAGSVVLNSGSTLAVGGDDSSTSFSGVISQSSGVGSLTKIGTGSFTLSGTNTYTGATQVDGGELRVNGSVQGTVGVASGATLGGSGAIAGAVTVASGGTLSAGSSPGTLTVGSLELNSGANTVFELNSPGVVGGGTNDHIIVNGSGAAGNLVLGGTLTANVASAGYYRLFDVTGGGAISGSFDTLALTAPSVAGATGTVYNAPSGVPTQVNLAVLGTSQAMQFWDGSDQLGNGTVDGGAGTWNAGNANWTGAPGQADFNAPWSDSVGVF
ncbi:hypothetical protein DWF00_14880 [Bosea caraganae]|uniref:Autotransporter outer membrane beta-barrel domain-containing protein n=1 Tax=Bosea caraganae TaxID=2763117 RepID=A0A370L6Z5_9HYPH|nr:hypothetical protein DWE98_12505 [Bosea caraganae]RDJ25683.1 hypothetical protein DWF00_14880 [Bosea caraganae]